MTTHVVHRRSTAGVYEDLENPSRESFITRGKASRSPRCTRLSWAKGVVSFIVVVVLFLVQKRYFYGVTEFVDHRVVDAESTDACELNGFEPREGPPPRVFDVFQFNNEFDMLEIRLHELDDAVDYFVIIESTSTHSGHPKPLHYQENKHDPRFESFRHKIVSYVAPINNSFRFSDAHEREAYQRSFVVPALDDAGARPEDWVIFSDVDEIPRGEYIRLLKSCTGFNLPVAFQTPIHLYDFGCVEFDQSWRRVKLARRDQIQRECTFQLFPTSVCPHDLRDDQNLRLGLFHWSTLTIYHGGWHLSFFMNEDQIVAKLGAASHPERNTPENRDKRTLKCLKRYCKHINRVDRGVRYADAWESWPGREAPKWVLEQALLKVQPFASYFPRISDLEYHGDESDC